MSLKAKLGGGANASQIARSAVDERLRYGSANAIAAIMVITPAAIHGMLRAPHKEFVVSTTAADASVVKVFPEELVGDGSDSNANPRSCAE